MMLQICVQISVVNGPVPPLSTNLTFGDSLCLLSINRGSEVKQLLLLML